MRPSALYGIHDEFSAYCFDRAVSSFGMAVEADIREGTRDAKNDKQARNKAKLILHKWLTEPERTGSMQNMSKAGSRFQDPAERFKVKKE